MHHDLKCVQPWYGMVKQRIKPFEIRVNDRDFKQHDTVTLHEYNDFTKEFSGDSAGPFNIGCVVNYQQFPGVVVFSLLDQNGGDHGD